MTGTLFESISVKTRMPDLLSEAKRSIYMRKAEYRFFLSNPFTTLMHLWLHNYMTVIKATMNYTHKILF
ncbi:hypothetical protein SAMN06265218_10649 [Fodinibius sediminis]|uniref:Uncharacterized protein n=1 Tax=Fodinibius sediminis TaxID=1214077 RepID=A0A521CGA2_9BACT|nr:hypothetical protein SAMN06265218_10649 [Fodinibius sediminis]